MNTKNMTNTSCQKSWNIKIKINIKNSFEEKRKIGEDDSEVCQIIRSDSLDEFISFISNKQKEIKENNNDNNNDILFIPDSIYEMNQS